MFGKRKPGPSEAVHVSDDGKRSKCGQDVRGEPRLASATVTCPVCCRKNGRHANCGCR